LIAISFKELSKEISKDTIRSITNRVCRARVRTDSFLILGMCRWSLIYKGTKDLIDRRLFLKEDSPKYSHSMVFIVFINLLVNIYIEIKSDLRKAFQFRESDSVIDEIKEEKSEEDVEEKIDSTKDDHTMKKKKNIVIEEEIMEESSSCDK
jgi:hypothetical protein